MNKENHRSKPENKSMAPEKGGYKLKPKSRKDLIAHETAMGLIPPSRPPKI